MAEIITDISQYKLDSYLANKQVFAIIFKDGSVKLVERYNEERHMIYFVDKSSGDLYVLINYIAAYRLKENIAIKNTELKTNKASKLKKTTKAQTPKKTFSIYGLAKGKPGKKYTIKQFLQITKNAKKKPGGSNTDKTLKLDDGYIYVADSQQEISTLKKLISHDAFKRLRGQCINIPYKFGGKTHNYYPDFILLTQTNKIVIMEVKEVAQMNTKQNLRKYEALKRYCDKNGYLYIMCDKSFTPFEQLSDQTGSNAVNNAINGALDEKGYFDYSDYKELIKNKDYKKVKWYRKAIGIYIASNRTVKMVGDLTYKSTSFRIIKKKT